jgi:hypothetical protein
LTQVKVRDSFRRHARPIPLAQEAKERPMLSWEDCVGLAELTEEEIEAIARHEHLPHLAALALGEYLVHCPDGCARVKRMILDDIDEARSRGDFLAVLKLRLALQHFVTQYAPELARDLARGPAA